MSRGSKPGVSRTAGGRRPPPPEDWAVASAAADDTKETTIAATSPREPSARLSIRQFGAPIALRRWQDRGASPVSVPAPSTMQTCQQARYDACFGGFLAATGHRCLEDSM